MTTDILRNAAHCAAARAHLYGGEAVALEAEDKALQKHAAEKPLSFICAMNKSIDISRSARVARRRYWREVSSAALLAGWRWPEAEAMGEGL